MIEDKGVASAVLKRSRFTIGVIIDPESNRIEIKAAGSTAAYLPFYSPQSLWRSGGIVELLNLEKC
ncbi:hypothetical protein [Paenibacillus sp. 32352]|uniref:hypothetical protein n=1 Tax=Paenibacillus sp. 32352 TaxID=1969111 RepID=UPI0009AE5AAF|nr:hypothetical protein [Paenibacillus sp. 32352]